MTPLMLILLAIYVIPSVVAFGQGHRQAVPILLLNLLLGWTLVGWVAALVWAASRPSQPVVIYQRPNDPTA
jgi:Superinfection immunity protein